MFPLNKLSEVDQTNSLCGFESSQNVFFAYWDKYKWNFMFLLLCLSLHLSLSTSIALSKCNFVSILFLQFLEDNNLYST